MTDWFNKVVAGDSSRIEKWPTGNTHHPAALCSAFLFTSSGKPSESGKYQTSEKICKAKKINSQSQNLQ